MNFEVLEVSSIDKLIDVYTNVKPIPNQTSIEEYKNIDLVPIPKELLLKILKSYKITVAITNKLSDGLDILENMANSSKKETVH